MNLFIDLETIPDQRKDALDRVKSTLKAPANYKKPEAIEKYISENADEALAKTALKGLYGEICSIAWAIDDNPVQALTRPASMSEGDLLTKFFDTVKTQSKSGQGDYPNITWIGHNIIEFDLRFLKQRALVNRVKPAFFIPADARHGNTAFDTMKEWAGWKGYVKLDELCEVFGFEGKGDVDGSMVGKLWTDGEYHTIQEYNMQDVEIVRNVYRRMTWTE